MNEHVLELMLFRILLHLRGAGVWDTTFKSITVPSTRFVSRCIVPVCIEVPAFCCPRTKSWRTRGMQFHQFHSKENTSTKKRSDSMPPVHFQAPKRRRGALEGGGVATLSSHETTASCCSLKLKMLPIPFYHHRSLFLLLPNNSTITRHDVLQQMHIMVYIQPRGAHLAVSTIVSNRKRVPRMPPSPAASASRHPGDRTPGMFPEALSSLASP